MKQNFTVRRGALDGVEAFLTVAQHRNFRKAAAQMGVTPSAIGQAVQNEVAGISALAARGGKDFLVLNVPDLGKTPNEIAKPATQTTATYLSGLYNVELAQAVDGLRASGALKIDLIDTFGLLNLAIANPAAAGFTDVTTPEWTGNLTDSHSGTLNTTGSHLYFDNIHPTAQAHALLADHIVPTLPMA